MLMLSILIFLAVVLACAGLYFLLVPTRTQQRLRTMAGPEEKGNWIEAASTVVAPFAKLSMPEGDWDTSPLRLKFLNAGIRHADARLLYFGAKSALPLLFAGAAYFLLMASGHAGGQVMLFWLLVAALAGCYLPNILLYLQVKSRTREIFETFPDAADLMLVCVEAGMGLDAAMVKVADEIRMKSMALAEELHLTNLEMRVGATREKAMRNLALRTGVEEVATFAAMLTQADKFGTSIGDSLRVFSDELRHKRQTRAEELAAKIPTKMLFPLVVCIFPSIIMVIMGPAIIQIVRTLLPMITKGSL
ncbi:MAG TPA: type II secretion system F family protein [Noviherbaspirillum sp.]|uniref:type II secretion system F family protein n=1 Tax=Noviherbaspirillum sp. TaxID=1926288 RepID=UPI002D330B22|nr:type II secretion system F family protein [Noviherbaspirillum sp.]HYD97603.1 type II secretion system F family protein [Noviherbaspirillum sp.]